MTEAELMQIDQRCRKAAPGPWLSFVAGRDHESGASYIMTGPDDSRGPDFEISGASAQDQDFIAGARADIPRLLEEVRVLHEILLAKNGIHMA
jgi:hypothetical protein